MRKRLFDTLLFPVFICCFFLAGCGNSDRVETETDTPLSGTIHISVDESFRPVIEEQIKVYEGDFPGTKIIADYKPESECIKDILRDSATRMIIVTRGLNRKEEKYFRDSLNFVPPSVKIATDAIAIILNSKSTDTLFTFDRLRKLLSGQSGSKQKVVFDGLSATSTIRFAIDSILLGGKFDTSVVKAVKNSAEVLDYVASDENAIGFVGISWIGNPEEKSQVDMLKKVKMGYIRCDKCKDTPYVKPSQYEILAKQYPLVRGLYYVIKENHTGLGTGFAGFLQYERGQLIFRRAYIGPKMGFGIRNVKINEKLASD